VEQQWSLTTNLVIDLHVMLIVHTGASVYGKFPYVVRDCVDRLGSQNNKPQNEIITENSIKGNNIIILPRITEN
jgi:hypothetical protein